jgi:pyridoxal phosphate enzyme (YggS family)
MIAENVKNIQEKIKSACIAAGRSPDSVTLIAVSKTFGYDKIMEVARAGVLDVGENYVQEVTAKRGQISDNRIRWHFIGHMQSNKVKYIADWIHLIHSIDNANVATEVEKRGARLGRTVGVLVEVNTSGEATKYGVRPNEAAELIRRIAVHPHLNVQGLMTIGPFSTDLEQSRQSFRLLKNIFDNVNSAGILPQPMTHLSMGMTQDFPVAIAEGSTIVRIGRAIFGSRTKPNAN